MVASKDYLFNFNVTHGYSETWRLLDFTPHEFLHGRIVVQSGNRSQSSEIEVHAKVQSADEDNLENFNFFYYVPSTLEIEYRYWDSSHLCTQLELLIFLRPGTNLSLDTLGIRSENLDIVFGTPSPAGWELNTLLAYTVYGNIDMFFDGPQPTALDDWSPSIIRNLELRSHYGEIIGFYLVYNNLTIHNVHGAIYGFFYCHTTNAHPTPAMQNIDIGNVAGEVDVELFPWDEWPAPWTYTHRTTVATKSGNLRAVVPHGSYTNIFSTSGDIEAFIFPSHICGSRLYTASESGNTRVVFADTLPERPEYDDLTPACNIFSRHVGGTGSLKLEYPSLWFGHLEATTGGGEAKLNGTELYDVERKEGFVSAYRGRDMQIWGNLILAQVETGTVDIEIGFFSKPDPFRERKRPLSNLVPADSRPLIFPPSISPNPPKLPSSISPKPPIISHNDKFCQNHTLVVDRYHRLSFNIMNGDATNDWKLIDSVTPKSRKQLQGKIYVEYGDAAQPSDFEVIIHIGSTHEEYLDSILISHSPDTLSLDYKHQDVDDLCTHLEIHILYHPRVRRSLNAFTILTNNLDIDLVDAFNFGWKLNTLTAHSSHGDISSDTWLPGFNAHHVSISSTDGAISGYFAVHASLTLRNERGPISAWLARGLPALDGTRPTLQNITVSNDAGDIDVRAIPWHDWAEERYTHYTVLETQTGALRAVVPHGSFTNLSTTTGPLNATLLPFGAGTLDAKSEIYTSSRAGTAYVEVARTNPSSRGWDPLFNTKSRHEMGKGMLTLKYPDDWYGDLEGHVGHGQIKLEGTALRDVRWGEGVRATRGRERLVGESRLWARTGAGKLNLLFGVGGDEGDDDGAEVYRRGVSFGVAE